MKAILVALAHRADDATWECFPGQDTLASMTGTSRATVLRALAALESLGVLSRSRRSRQDGSRSSDLCILNHAYVAQSNVAPSHVAQSNVAPSDGLSVTVQRPMLHGATAEKPVDHSEEKPVVPRRRGTRLSPDFAVTDKMREWARLNTPSIRVNDSTAMFIDYWQSSASANAVKRDWIAAWQFWLRKDESRIPANERSKPKRVVTSGPHEAQFCDRHRLERKPCDECVREATR